MFRDDPALKYKKYIAAKLMENAIEKDEKIAELKRIYAEKTKIIADHQRKVCHQIAT